MIVGVLLILLGGIILVRGLTYKTTEQVAKVGDVAITDTDKHGVPQWVGIAALAGGVVIVAAGATKKS
jgi:hypothetical protein